MEAPKINMEKTGKLEQTQSNRMWFDKEVNSKIVVFTIWAIEN